MKKKPTFKSLKGKAWKIFSEYIRRREADAGGTTNCYTCGIFAHWKDLQCGHAIGGRYHAVLFDAEICRPQCYRCNVGFRGNYATFTMKLIREKSPDWFEEKLIEARKVVKLSPEDMQRIAETYKQKLKELEPS